MTKFRILAEQSEFSIHGRSSLHPLHAKTNALDGFLNIELLPDNRPDLSKPIRGRLEVDITNLKSGNPLYDLEAHRRVNTQRYPKITIDLLDAREVEPLRRYHVTGNINFRGLSRPIEGELKVIARADGTFEVSGTQKLDSRDFGLDPPKLLGLKVYSDFVAELKLVAELVYGQ